MNPSITICFSFIKRTKICLKTKKNFFLFQIHVPACFLQTNKFQFYSFLLRSIFNLIYISIKPTKKSIKESLI